VTATLRHRVSASIVLSVIAILLVGCDDERTPTGADPPVGAPMPTRSAVRVLMLTATAGFRHDAIPVAQQVMSAMAASSGEFTVTVTEQLSRLDAGELAAFDVVFFALTSGELPLTDAQKTALIAFVENGGGFLGVHSATDTLYSWPAYGGLVGAYFREHPWTQLATVIVEDGTHPSTQGLGASFAINEEFYTFQENPRPRVQVLLRLDPGSVRATGDFPLAWTHAVGRGRAYYNALGHFPETWRDVRFQRQLLGAIRSVGAGAGRSVAPSS
jgi:type 1 glutamine amidotransferase